MSRLCGVSIVLGLVIYWLNERPCGSCANDRMAWRKAGRWDKSGKFIVCLPDSLCLQTSESDKYFSPLFQVTTPFSFRDSGSFAYPSHKYFVPYFWAVRIPVEWLNFPDYQFRDIK